MLLVTESIDCIRKKISGSPRLACFIYSYLPLLDGDSIKQSFEDHLRAINEFHDDDVTGHLITGIGINWKVLFVRV